MIGIVFALLLQATPPAAAPSTAATEAGQKEAPAESEAASAAEITAAPSGEAATPAGVTCRRQPILGSRVRTQMVCTESGQTRADQEALRQMQNYNGSTQAWRGNWTRGQVCEQKKARLVGGPFDSHLANAQPSSV